MPNCLLDFVGLRSCTAETPLSEVWINSYPGMSTELADKIASQDQVTYATVWRDVQSQCYQRIKTDIQQALKDFANVRLDQTIFQTAKIFVQQWQQVDPIGANAIFKGAFLSCNGSKYMGLRVKQIYIYNSGDVAVENVPIKFFQTQDGSVLYETTKTIQPGANTFQINQVFTSFFDKINIALMVDCTDLPTLQGTFIDYGWQAWNEECASRYNAWILQPGFSSFPVTAPLDYGLGSEWTQQSSQAGIYWDAQLICSLDSFICEQKFDLIDAWANLLCSAMLETKLLSNRVNYFTQSNRDYTERAIPTFLGRYKEALSNWAQQLQLIGEGLCFSCEAEELIGKSMARM
jgi:hypothetical protein